MKGSSVPSGLATHTMAEKSRSRRMAPRSQVRSNPLRGREDLDHPKADDPVPWCDRGSRSSDLCESAEHGQVFSRTTE